MSVLIDGIDMRTLGVRDSDIPELRDGLEVGYPTGSVPGRGAVHLSRRGLPRERRITIVGWIAQEDHAAALAALDSVKRRLARREVQIVVADQVARYIHGVPESIRFPTIAPYQIQHGTHIRWTFLCVDPLFYAVAADSVAFGAATQIPLGSAPSLPVLTLTNPSGDIAVIYRSSAGLELARIEFSDVSGSELVIDCDNQVITIDDENGAGLLSGGDFFALDPLHGSEGGPYPTLEVSGATSGTATYRRAWS